MLQHKIFPMIAGALLAGAVHAQAAITNNTGVYITEFVSNAGDGNNFEYVEITNRSASPVDMTDWSEDDSGSSANKSGHILTGLGILSPGESAIFTEASPAAFRAYWGLSASIKVVGPYSNDNLGSSGDSVTLFDNTGTLVDQVDYSTGTGGSGNGVARNAPLAALGQNNNALWANSSVGDAYGSFAAAQNSALIGSPGSYLPAAVPEPASLGILGTATLMFFMRRRRGFKCGRDTMPSSR